MKKRLRKKLYKGEFKEIGFEIKCLFSEEMPESDFDGFIDDFIDAIESKGLVFGGGGSHKISWEGVISREKRYSCTDESDRLFISNWMNSRKEVRDYTIGRDIDLWYPPEEFA